MENNATEWLAELVEYAEKLFDTVQLFNQIFVITSSEEQEIVEMISENVSKIYRWAKMLAECEEVLPHMSWDHARSLSSKTLGSTYTSLEVLKLIILEIRSLTPQEKRLYFAAYCNAISLLLLLSEDHNPFYAYDPSSQTTPYTNSPYMVLQAAWLSGSFFWSHKVDFYIPKPLQEQAPIVGNVSVLGNLLESIIHMLFKHQQTRQSVHFLLQEEPEHCVFIMTNPHLTAETWAIFQQQFYSQSALLRLGGSIGPLTHEANGRQGLILRLPWANNPS